MANIFQIDVSHLHSSDVSHIGSYYSNNDNQGTLSLIVDKLSNSSIDLVVEHSSGEIHSDSSTISIFTNDINMKN